MGLRGEELRIDGQALSPDIAGSLEAASLIRRMDGATSLELTVSDPDMRFLLSGALTRPGRPSKRQEGLKAAAWDRFAKARLSLDGVSFTFVGFEGLYDQAPFRCVLTFEDTLATVMRARDEPVKTSRGQDTRAEFIGTLVAKSLQRSNVPFSRSGRFYSPQAGQRQPVAKVPAKDREKGIAKGKHLTVKGARADATQKRNMETVLTVADALRAGDRATLALVVACITESQFRNLPGGDADSQGILQVQHRTAVGITPRTVIDPRTGQVHGGVQHTDDAGVIAPGTLDPRDVKNCARTFLLRGFTGVGAIKYATDHPDAEVYQIAQVVQGSGAGSASNGQSNYGPWVEEAKTILDAWGGAGRLHTIRESFEYRAGGRRNGSSQNYFDDSGNLAQDVNWRRLVDLNRCWFVSDEWLFERRPIYVIDGADGLRGLAAQGLIGGPSCQVDVGSPVSEIRQRAFLPRWEGPPGGVVEYEHMGPLTGRWLIWQDTQDLLAPTETVELLLHRPEPTKREPAPSTRTTQLTETRPETGSARDAIIRALDKALTLVSRYRYEQKRPMPDTLFPKDTVSILHFDCSAFATLIYKAANVPDPNGANYNGSGYTGTLAANGKRTSDPQPGDLVFYGSGPPYGHVAVYYGNGKVVGMGGTPGPLKLNVDYRKDRGEYRTYDLGSGA